MTKSLFEQLIESASDRFKSRYGRDPRWIAAAPGRVNIIGEHIDYNYGFVLPMAPDRNSVIAAADKPSDNATIFSIATDDEALRRMFLWQHLEGLVQALNGGVNIIGYLYWSLLDNFEWVLGTKARFGLVAVDFTSQQRLPRLCAEDFARVCRTNQIYCPATNHGASEGNGR